MTDVLTLGESMLLVRVTDVGPLVPGASAVVSFAGSESNVAVGLARLGHAVTWVGRLGTDAPGRMVSQAMTAEGVDVVAVLDPQAPTGVLVRHPRIAGRHEVSYVRAGSAGSRLRPNDLPDGAVEQARLLHVTGITPALSEDACAAVREAVRRARAAGVEVSLDVNHRSRLWSRERAAPVLRELAALAQVVVAGADELTVLTDETDAGAAVADLLSAGCTEVVVTDGPRGARVTTRQQESAVPAVAVEVLDPVGAGDAFVAGYLSARLEGLPLAERLARGVACAGFAVSTPGDWEGLPRRRELPVLGAPDVAR